MWPAESERREKGREGRRGVSGKYLARVGSFLEKFFNPRPTDDVPPSLNVTNPDGLSIGIDLNPIVWYT